MRRAHAAVLLSLLLLALSGCGRGDDASATWDGPPAPAADGSVDVSGFNDYASEVDETWKGSPTQAAAQFLRLDERSAAITISTERRGREGSGPSTVTVTLDGLPDDSVRSERWELTFTPEGSAHTLSQARWAQRCRPGRGHTTFSAEPCV